MRFDENARLWLVIASSLLDKGLLSPCLIGVASRRALICRWRLPSSMARDAVALKFSRFIGRLPGPEDTVELVEQRHQPLGNVAACDQV